MYTANGRVGKRPTDKATKASVTGKEFQCSACGKKLYLTNVEFGETVVCTCGNTMEDNTTK